MTKLSCKAMNPDVHFLLTEIQHFLRVLHTVREELVDCSGRDDVRERLGEHQSSDERLKGIEPVFRQFISNEPFDDVYGQRVAGPADSQLTDLSRN